MKIFSILFFVSLILILVICFLILKKTEDEKAKLEYMYSLLDSVVDILKAHGISYYIDCGSLLGFIREKGLLKNDSDVDVTIHLDDWERLKEIDFSSIGLLKTRQKEKYGRIISVRKPNKKLYCDIYANPAFPLLDTVDIVNPDGEMKTYHVPVQSDLYLTLLYGDWRKPSSKHADWPRFFYKGLLTSEYKPFFDPKYKIVKII